jgi:hypothetical protein
MSTQTYRTLVPIAQHDAIPQAITALSFDPTSDTLWSGTNSGDVTAYYTAQGLRGVSFPVGGGLAVNKVISDETQVRAQGVAGEGVGAWSKGGVNKWYYRCAEGFSCYQSPRITPCSPSASVTTFSSTISSSKTVAVSTSALEIALLNSITGSVIRQASVSSVIRHLHFTHSYLLSGDTDGFLRCHDHRTGLRREGAAENTVRAHASEMQGLQSSGNYVYTIGWGLR